MDTHSTRNKPLLEESERLLSRVATLKFDPLKATPLFNSVLAEVKAAIHNGIQPTLIAQGSSGSYFCRNREGKIIAVFKPKNEEPYGDFNPKWKKWVQRTLCRCCFGRSCLLNNTGYISEAAASIVSRRMGLDIVPETAIVRLASPAFNYNYVRRKLANSKIPSHHIELPPKLGSFQLFVLGYEGADTFMALRISKLNIDEQEQFRKQFERLVILDYIIRNTDRGGDNWLVRWNSKNASEGTGQVLETTNHNQAVESICSGVTNEITGEILIAGIDNGLAFPFKHPDNWRTYPFGWAVIPQAHFPFSKEFASDVLSMIESNTWREQLIDDLRQVMQIDNHFSEYAFQRQMGVLRGQMYNIAHVLREGGTPFDLINKSPVIVDTHPDKGFLLRILRSRPCFSSC